jgi:hypothetical protein
VVAAWAAELARTSRSAGRLQRERIGDMQAHLRVRG